MTQDLSIYSFHPPRKHLILSLVAIAAMAVFGLVRGIMGAAELDYGRRWDVSAPPAQADQLPKAVDLTGFTALTPKAILPEGAPAPAAAKADETALSAATNTVAAAPIAPVIEAPAAVPVAPVAPPPAATAPPAPPRFPDDGPIF